MSASNESPEEAHNELIQEELMSDVSVYKHGVQTLYLYNGAESTRLFKRVGTTTDYDEMVEHDGPVLLNGSYRVLEEDDSGVITAYHPWAGQMGFYTNLEEPEIPTIKLEAIEKVA